MTKRGYKPKITFSGYYKKEFSYTTSETNDLEIEREYQPQFIFDTKPNLDNPTSVETPEATTSIEGRKTTSAGLLESILRGETNIKNTFLHIILFLMFIIVAGLLVIDDNKAGRLYDLDGINFLINYKLRYILIFYIICEFLLLILLCITKKSKRNGE